MEVSVMGYVKCKNGHLYNPSVTPTCPQCAADAGENNFEGYGATEPVSPPSMGGGYVSATEPFNGPRFSSGNGGFSTTEPGFGSLTYTAENADFNKTTPLGDKEPDFFSPMPPTEPLSSFGGTSRSGGEFSSEMPVTMPLGFQERFPPVPDPQVTKPTYPAYPFRPVVGWLVCVEGADRGRDYQIRDGYNTIGRDPSNDIAIQNDNFISREKHAMIAYDRREKVFFFGPAEGRNIVRLNGKLLMQASEIHPYDIIDFESTKLMFVPFCGERFNWDE